MGDQRLFLLTAYVDLITDIAIHDIRYCSPLLPLSQPYSAITLP